MSIVERILDVIEEDIIPITRRNVAKGCKLFGAAIIRKSDLSLVIAESNNEIENPMWHGEIHCLKRYYELKDRPSPKDCIFIATHEPCSLCLNGITWSGFDNFYYLFSHKDSMLEFGIPYDIQILKAIHAVPDPDRPQPQEGRDLYNRFNEFFSSHSLKELSKNNEALEARFAAIKNTYDQISADYQATKGQHGDLFMP